MSVRSTLQRAWPCWTLTVMATSRHPGTEESSRCPGAKVNSNTSLRQGRSKDGTHHGLCFRSSSSDGEMPKKDIRYCGCKDDMQRVVVVLVAVVIAVSHVQSSRSLWICLFFFLPPLAVHRRRMDPPAGSTLQAAFSSNLSVACTVVVAVLVMRRWDEASWCPI